MATVVTTDPPEVEISIEQGASKTLEVSVVDKVGAPVSLTGATCYFTVKETTNDVVPLFAKTSATPTQILITDALNGVFRIFLNPADTAALALGTCMCDIWVKLSSGKQYPVIAPSVFEIKPRVTVIP
jgi:hypothetical protein